MKKKLLKTVLMAAILLGCIWGLGVYLMPHYWEWNLDNKLKGYYKEADETFQMVALGTSSQGNGLASTYLYDRYGLNSYNLATEQQPMIASLSWLEETMRLHGDSMQFVLLDMSYLFKTAEENRSNNKYFEKNINYMRLTPTKMKIFLDAKKYYDEFSILEFLTPAVHYHYRWYKLDAEDLDLLKEDGNTYYSRGQNVVFDVAKYNEDLTGDENEEITEIIDYSEDEIEDYLGQYETEIFDEIVMYCEEHDLQLILVKMPTFWTDINHDSVQYLADRYGIPFIDFNLQSIKDECDLNMDNDGMDKKHLNIKGSVKVTDYIGSYIRDNYEFTDSRTSERCSYISAQTADFENALSDADLNYCEDFDEYVSMLDQDRYTIFLSVSGDASGMSENARAMFREMGLAELSEIKKGQTYAGVIHKGNVLAEKIGDNASQGVSLSGFYGLYDDSETAVNDSRLRKSIVKIRDDRNLFDVISDDKGSSIMFDNRELSKNGAGLNMVIYDNNLSAMVDSASFDLSNGSRNRTTVPREE